MELEFYNFALKHFKTMKKMVKNQKSSEGKPQFVFEKVRPKWRKWHLFYTMSGENRFLD